MPEWSPVRTFGGYAAWGDPNGAGKPALNRKLAMNCGCANACNIHGHDHARAWPKKLPVSDLQSFWGSARMRLPGGLRKLHDGSGIACV
jgi:hypothetical protein